MNADERRQQILELVAKNGTVKVATLSRLFNITEVTVRSDLADMESKGLLSRVHGGAVSSCKPYYSMNFNQRLSANEAEKMAVAKETAAMVENNDTLMLNSGTTTLLIFRMIPRDYNLTIVTNSISIALEAASNPSFNLLLVGGSVNSKYQFTYGDDAVNQIKRYHADKLILSVDGIDLENGLSTFYDKEAVIDRAMLAQSGLSIIAADFSKINRTAFAGISELTAADYIVTNDSISSELVGEISEKGVEVRLCGRL